MPRLAALLLLLCATLAGCGLGEGEEKGGGAEIRITRDFGERQLAASRIEKVREDQTVMRALQEGHRVDTRYGGRFVQAIDGLAGTTKGGRHDWFFFVNGVEAGKGAAEFELNPGDVVQWDYRNWEAAMRVPAIVGAYPEPFLHGLEGKRLPLRVECADPAGTACAEVTRRLGREGIPASRGTLGNPVRGKLLRIVVAPWATARRLGSIATIEDGPARSGVFARFEDGGHRLELLDARGEPVRTAPAGSGLVAATGFGDQKAIWVVTGVDERGVLAAARALDPRTLRNAFAIAATPAGVLRLPLGGGS